MAHDFHGTQEKIFTQMNTLQQSRREQPSTALHYKYPTNSCSESIKRCIIEHYRFNQNKPSGA